jgi:excinuclease ABC subunit B
MLRVQSEFTPSGDQPTAIRSLVDGLNSGLRSQTLLGATGTGKTYTVAKVIEETGRPALIMALLRLLSARSLRSRQRPVY